MKCQELLDQLNELTPEQKEMEVLVWDEYGCKTRRCMGLDVVPEEGDEPEEIIIF